MKLIIEKISDKYGVSYSMEESTWFNGSMNVPLKTYNIQFPTLLGNIRLTGEYRRNIWLKANWYKSLYDTDIYLWTIKLISNEKLPEFEITKNGWYRKVILNEPQLHIKCKNLKLKKGLQQVGVLIDILTGDKETVSATIRCSDQLLWTSFNTLINHEELIINFLFAIEEIENEIKNNS